MAGGDGVHSPKRSKQNSLVKVNHHWRWRSKTSVLLGNPLDVFLPSSYVYLASGTKRCARLYHPRAHHRQSLSTGRSYPRPNREFKKKNPRPRSSNESVPEGLSRYHHWTFLRMPGSRITCYHCAFLEITENVDRSQPPAWGCAYNLPLFPITRPKKRDHRKTIG